MSLKPQKIVLFDLDGTLTYGVSSTKFLFRRAGDEAFFEHLEQEWLKDRMDHPTLAAQVTRRMTGWKVRDMESSLHLIPKMTGIAATVRARRRRPDPDQEKILRAVVRKSWRPWRHGV